jgi:hypothetical protein
MSGGAGASKLSLMSLRKKHGYRYSGPEPQQLHATSP